MSRAKRARRPERGQWVRKGLEDLDFAVLKTGLILPIPRGDVADGCQSITVTYGMALEKPSEAGRDAAGAPILMPRARCVLDLELMAATGQRVFREVPK